MELYLLTVLKEYEFEQSDYDGWIYATLEAALAQYGIEVDNAREAYKCCDKHENEIATEHYRYYEICDQQCANRIVIVVEKKILND